MGFIITYINIQTDSRLMGRHVMEALGKSRVVMEDVKVVSVSEPKVKYCPLFKKYRGI